MTTRDPDTVYAVILPTGHVESASENRIHAIADCGQGCHIAAYAMFRWRKEDERLAAERKRREGK